MTKTISQNTTYLTIASVLQKVLAFVYFTVIANVIGVEGTGQYFFALSFTTIFVVFIDLGFTNVFIREAAKAKDQIQSYLSTLLTFKLGMAVLTYIAAVVVIHLLGRPADVRLLVYVSGITMLFDTFHLTLYGGLRALGDLRYEGVGIVGSQFLTLILGSIFLWLQLPLVFLILAFTIPSALNVLFAAAVLIRKYRLQVRFSFDRDVFMYLGKIAIPFAIAAIFARLYSYVDTMLLAQFLGDVAVGLYSIPYKITFAFQFIPLALVAALYPKFSELYTTDKGRLAFVFERGLVYLLIVAVPIAVGISVLAYDIIALIYDDAYLASVVPLQILISSLIFSFASFPIGAFMNACDRQVTQTKIVGVVLLVNIIANVLLTPEIGVAGAAIAALIGNALLTILGYIYSRTITKIDHGYIARQLFLILLCGGIMGAAVVAANTVHLFVAIGVGAVTYPLLLLLLRVVTPAQLRETVRLIKG